MVKKDNKRVGTRSVKLYLVLPCSYATSFGLNKLTYISLALWSKLASLTYCLVLARALCYVWRLET